MSKEKPVEINDEKNKKESDQKEVVEVPVFISRDDSIKLIYLINLKLDELTNRLDSLSVKLEEILKLAKE